MARSVASSFWNHQSTIELKTDPPSTRSSLNQQNFLEGLSLELNWSCTSNQLAGYSSSTIAASKHSLRTPSISKLPGEVFLSYHFLASLILIPAQRRSQFGSPNVSLLTVIKPQKSRGRETTCSALPEGQLLTRESKSPGLKRVKCVWWCFQITGT